MIYQSKSAIRASYKELFLTLIFILATANPFFMQNIEATLIFFFVFIFYFFPKRILLAKNHLYAALIILFFIGFEIIHSFYYDLNNFKTIFRVSSYFIGAYFFSIVLQRRFLISYIKIVYFFSIISLFFYGLAYISPNIYSSLSNLGASIFPLRLDYNNYSTPTIGIYTFDPSFAARKSILLRNPGFAWEAGGFATYLNFAFLFNLIRENPKSLKQIFDSKINWILIISLILTYSTAGYIVFTLVLIGYFGDKLSFTNLFAIISLIFISIFLYFRLPFLNDKISMQLSEAYDSQNRFGAAILDWDDIKRSPFIGWSRDLKVLFGSENYDQFSHRPNGLTNFLRTYGFIYVITYFVLLYRSFNKYIGIYNFNKRKVHSILLITIVILMGFTQQIIHTLFIMSLIFIHVNLNYKTHGSE